MPNAPKLRPVLSHAGLLQHKTELEARPLRGVPARVSLPKSRAEPLLAALERGRSLVASTAKQRGKVLLLSETDEDKLKRAGVLYEAYLRDVAKRPVTLSSVAPGPLNTSDPSSTPC